MKLGLLVVDTLRYDTCIQEMPNLFQLDGMKFENMYSTSRWTGPAHSSLFTGYYPSEVGTQSGNHHLTTQEKTLGERLSNCGYENIGFTENVNIDPFYDFDRGFNEFYRSPSFRNRPRENPTEYEWGDFRHDIPDSGLYRYIETFRKIYNSDSPTLPTLKTGLQLLLSSSSSKDNRDCEWIYEKLKKILFPEDVFIFMNIMPCHYPYDPPEGYSQYETSDAEPIDLMYDNSLDVEEHHQNHFENYKSTAKYCDDFVKKVVNLMDWDCLFIVSDHGELFGEHKMRGHYFGMYEELVHVPGFAIGNEIPNRDIESLSSILDIPYTLLSIADAKIPDSMRGVDLRSENFGERDVYAESVGSEWYRNNKESDYDIPKYWGDEHYMIREGNKKLSISSNSKTFETIGSGHSTDTSPTKEELRDRLEKLRENRLDLAGNDGRKEVPEEINHQLKALGYK